MPQDLVFLSCPYTHDDPRVVEFRVNALCLIDTWLSSRGIHTISPLFKVLTIQAAKKQAPKMDLPLTYDFWKGYCRTLMEASSKVLVLPLTGWEASEGVADEIRIATELSKPHEVLPIETVMQILGKLGTSPLG